VVGFSQSQAVAAAVASRLPAAGGGSKISEAAEGMEEHPGTGRKQESKVPRTVPEYWGRNKGRSEEGRNQKPRQMTTHRGWRGRLPRGAAQSGP